MLFEKIPGLYGSGIIELKFEEIKASLKGQFYLKKIIKKIIWRIES